MKVTWGCAYYAMATLAVADSSHGDFAWGPSREGGGRFSTAGGFASTFGGVPVIAGRVSSNDLRLVLFRTRSRLAIYIMRGGWGAVASRRHRTGSRCEGGLPLARQRWFRCPHLRGSRRGTAGDAAGGDQRGPRCGDVAGTVWGGATINFGTYHSLSDRRLSGAYRVQSQDGAGHSHNDAGG